MDFITDDSEFQLPESKFDETLSSETLNEINILAETPLLTQSAPDSDQEMVQKALALAKSLEAADDRKSGRPAGELTPVSSSEPQAMLALTSADEGGKGIYDLCYHHYLFFSPHHPLSYSYAILWVRG